MSHRNLAQNYVEAMVLPYAGDDCLIWPFRRNNKGYAAASIEGRTVIVSRFVCEKVHGQPPTQQHQAAHVCGRGNHGCVSPRHLVWKTRRENEADKIAHGTRLRGNEAPGSKLTSDDVDLIRASVGLDTQNELAARYGVNRSTISFIQSGKRWAHLGQPPKLKAECLHCRRHFDLVRPRQKYCCDGCRSLYRTAARRASRIKPTPEEFEFTPARRTALMARSGAFGR